jgi:hypothetical protein
LLDPLRLIVEYLVVPIWHIGGGGIVVKRVGRLCLPGKLNQAREVFPTQKT